MPWFGSSSDSKNTGFWATVGPLTVWEFKKLVRMGLIIPDTEVRHDSDPTRWVRASTEPSLRPFFGERTLRENINLLFAELGRLFLPEPMPDFRVPEQLYETVGDYLDKRTGDVALTLGKAHGQPVIIVLFKERDKDPQVVAEIEVDTQGWSGQAVAAWPETNSERAPFWKVSR